VIEHRRAECVAAENRIADEARVRLRQRRLDVLPPRPLGPVFGGTAMELLVDQDLKESRELRTADVTAWHVRLLIPYVRTLELNRIHDRTLERFIADRLAA